MMAYVLSRDKALTIPLLSTYGTAVLLSKDCQEVLIPLAPLLGASTLVRSMVTQANLHPGVHGPLILSLDVAAEVLVSLREILSKGETDVREETIIEVKQVLGMLGVEANLRYYGKNKEYYENMPAGYEEHEKSYTCKCNICAPIEKSLSQNQQEITPVTLTVQNEKVTAECPYCTSVYTWRNELYEHIRRIHPCQEVPNIVTMEDEDSSSSSQNEQDITPVKLTIQNEKVTAECPYCTSVNTWRDAMYEHIRRNHPGEELPNTVTMEDEDSSSSNMSSNTGGGSGAGMIRIMPANKAKTGQGVLEKYKRKKYILGLL